MSEKNEQTGTQLAEEQSGSRTKPSSSGEHKRNVVDALREANYTSIVFGWLAMMGAALVLSSIASGFIAAGFDQDGSDTNVVRSWERASFLTTVFFAFLVGGYVAGRIAGRSGVKHGIMVPLLALFTTLTLVLFGLVVGVGLVDSLSGVTLPDLPRGTRKSLDTILSASGILALIFIPFIGGAFGGAWGARVERRIVREGRKGKPECDPESE